MLATDFLLQEKSVDLVTFGCPAVFFDLLRAAVDVVDGAVAPIASPPTAFEDDKIAKELKVRARVRDHWRTFIVRSDTITQWTAPSLTHTWKDLEEVWLERAPVNTILLYEDEGRGSKAWRALALSNLPHSALYVERVVKRLASWNLARGTIDHSSGTYANALVAVAAGSRTGSKAGNHAALGLVEKFDLARSRSLKFVARAVATLNACEKESPKCELLLHAFDFTQSLLAMPASPESKTESARPRSSSLGAIPQSQRQVVAVKEAFDRMKAIPLLTPTFVPSLFDHVFLPRRNALPVHALPSKLCGNGLQPSEVPQWPKPLRFFTPEPARGGGGCSPTTRFLWRNLNER